MFAPFLPFVTDEVWSWWQQGSVHATAWPTAESIASLGDVSLLVPVSEVLGAIRRAKTEAKLSQRAGVEELIVDGPAHALAAIEACRADLAEAGGVAEFTLAMGDTLSTGDALLIAVRLMPSTNAEVAH